VLSRAIARDFIRARRSPGDALIMVAMAAAPGFSPLLGGARPHPYSRWLSEIRSLVGVFAAIGAIAMARLLGEGRIIRRDSAQIRLRLQKST